MVGMPVHVVELQFLVALLLDLVLGDPRWFPHPVRMIGWLCLRLERIFRSLPGHPRLAGVVTVAAVLGTTLGAVALLLGLANRVAPWAAAAVAVFLLYTSIAARDLIRHSRAVWAALQDESEAGLEAGRQAVAMIVGRDTATLDRVGVIRACVETVAENMVDGVTAPLFYAMLGVMCAPWLGLEPIVLAALGAMGYKAVNTMDSMFGYKNERYLVFGWAAARLDDAVNFLPSRLSGLLLVLAAVVLGLDGKKSLRIFLRDRLNHASPNSGHAEAAVAGALGVQLGGTSSYFGQPVAKPTMGDATRLLTTTDILTTNRLMLAGSALTLLVFLLIRRLVALA